MLIGRKEHVLEKAQYFVMKEKKKIAQNNNK